MNKTVAERFREQMQDLPDGVRIGVAVSGGVDSVVLCALCREAGLDFIVMHCHFGLRGAESDRDHDFVQRLAHQYGVPFVSRHFNTEEEAAQRKMSIQETARLLRYQWFAEVKSTEGLELVLLAHHANDHIETMLMNFFRGTGLEGLTGMKPFTPDGVCFRPLLDCTRKEILAYAKAHQLSWVEDSSNASSKYTRNFFRNELLPAIAQVYPKVEENLLDNVTRFRAVQAFYRQAMNSAIDSLVEKKGAEVHIPVRKLVQATPLLVYELIRPFGFNEKQVEEVLQLASAQSGKYIENAQYQVIRHRNWLIIAPKQAPAQNIAIGANTQAVDFPGGRLHFSIQPGNDVDQSLPENTAQLDASLIEYPLLLRRWKTGDYFYPLGLRNKKKLSRFFIDRKLSKQAKESAWVLESAQRIIWVVGMRIDDRVKVTPATQNVLSITWDHQVVTF